MIFDFLVAVICGVSAANIVTEEFIFGWLREFIATKIKNDYLTALFHCITCMGFWTGLLSGFIFLGLSPYVIAVALCSSIVGKLIKLYEE